jgi:hypothetical protein
MKKVLFAAIAIVAVSGGAAGLLRKRVPSSYKLERRDVIAAPPAAVLAEIVRAQNWIGWSPREQLDPNLRRTFGGPASGVGATYYWAGNDEAGTGHLTILSVTADTVEIEIEISKPVPSATDFALKVVPEGAGTRILWTASGDSNDSLIKKIGVLKSREKQVEEEVAGALARLKTIAEQQARTETYRAERSTTIAAPDVFVLGEIMDFREWAKWFPREQLDPEMRRIFSGTDASPGATYLWSGNAAVGAGRLTMISSSAEKVELEVELERPTDSVSDMVFTLTSEDANVRVVWTVTGEKNSFGMASTLLGSPPDAIGHEMEVGLAAMKALVESSMSQRPGPVRPKAAVKQPFVAPTLVGVAAPAKTRRIVLEPIVMNVSK